MTPTIPKDISFTLEGKPIPPGWVAPPAPAAPAATTTEVAATGTTTPPPAPTFGPEFGGTFKIKYPRALDRMRIAGLTTRAWELRGVDSPSRVPSLELQMQDAFTFFEVLGVETPEWLNPEAPDAALFVAAILAAHRVAEEELVAAKKKFDGNGASSSGTP